jgi:hypothetical protein
VKRVKIRFIPSEQEELTFSEEFVSQDTGANPEPESNGNGNGVAPGSHNHNHDHDHSHEDPVSRKKQ